MAFRVWVPVVVVPSYAVILYISWEKWVFFLDYCAVYVRKQSSTLWPDGLIRLFALYSIPLSLSCRRIRKYWTSKMLVKYILLTVCLRLSQFPQLSFMQYMRLCVFSWHISIFEDCENSVLYLIFIIKSGVWNLCHCWRLGPKMMYVFLYSSSLHTRWNANTMQGSVIPKGSTWKSRLGPESRNILDGV